MSNDFGYFAGGLADGFNQVFGQGQQRKIQEDIAKQQAKLVEMQLKKAGTQDLANKTLAEIMAGATTSGFNEPYQNPMQAKPNPVLGGGRMETPQFDFGQPGQLQEITKQVEPPKSLAAMMSEPYLQNLMVQGGNLDYGDLLDFEQTKMIQEGMPDFNKMFASLTGGEAGFDPQNSPYIPIPSIGPNGPSVTFQLNPNWRTPAQQSTDVKGLDKYFSQAVEAVDLLAMLEGTTFQSGNPLGDLWRTIGEGASAFGLPFATGEEQERLRDARGRLDKLLKTFVITSDEIDALTEAGSFSNAKLNILADASATLENGGVPNAQVIADTLEAKIIAADIRNDPVPNRAEMEQFISAIRQSAEQGILPGGKPAMDNSQIGQMITADQVKQMTQDQIQWLSQAYQQGMQISGDVQRALADRWEELNGR